MSKSPIVSIPLDQEERDLAALIESDAYIPAPSFLTLERARMLKAAALAKQESLVRAKISLRLPKGVLERLKTKAKEEGMPYQTLINSILHKAVSG
jgi:uncharacterized protein (DUF4415 family)